MRTPFFSGSVRLGSVPHALDAALELALHELLVAEGLEAHNPSHRLVAKLVGGNLANYTAHSCAFPSFFRFCFPGSEIVAFCFDPGWSSRRPRLGSPLP